MICQIISPGFRCESGCSSLFLSSFVSHSQKKQVSPVILPSEPWLFTVIFQASHDVLAPEVLASEWLFWNTSWGSKFTHFFSPGDITPLGGCVKPATPAREWKDLWHSGARRFSHPLRGIIQSRIYMQPALMSYVKEITKRSTPSTNPGSRGF